MERQPYPPPGSCVAKNSQRPASVETVQGGVPPYRVKDTLVVNGKKCPQQVSKAEAMFTFNIVITSLTHTGDTVSDRSDSCHDSCSVSVSCML